MAAKRGMRDQFSNKAYGSVTESGANTLTFSEIQTNVNTFDKIAWVVNRIEWYMDPTTLGLFTAGADAVQMALTASSNITSLGLDNPSVIDMLQYSIKYIGAVASFEFVNMPLIRDFSNLPGGGLIIAPRPLYVAAEGASLASAATVECRIQFQQITLDPSEYLELVDFYRIVS